MNHRGVDGVHGGNAAGRDPQLFTLARLFAGVSLEGTSMRPDDDASADVYGRKLTARQIVAGSGIGEPVIRLAAWPSFDCALDILGRRGANSA